MTKPVALIIEDNQKLANIFTEALKAAGFETEIALDGKAALEKLATTTPALILLDLHLPHLSGQKILEHIQAGSRLDKTEIILTTADSILAESLRHQVEWILLKPISFTQLRDLASRLRPIDTFTN